VREHRQLTQQALAGQLGWSRMRVVKIEAGTRVRLFLDEVLDLCQALEVDPVDMWAATPLVISHTVSTRID
jgi:transcriptional regulator with XRE-family HTH domain